MAIFHDSLPPPLSAAALVELKAHLGLTTDSNDALLYGYLRTALCLCEGFIGQSVLQRTITHRLVMHHAQQALPHRPVFAIQGVSKAGPNGSATPLPISGYSIDIDIAQKGYVRLNGPLPVLEPGEYIVADYIAGLASEWTYLPDSLRQGILLLAAHLYDQPRDTGGHPPAAVTALWRPWRQLRVA
jgi:uncharacterized phiE125 gp8 family phage protein